MTDAAPAKGALVWLDMDQRELDDAYRRHAEWMSTTLPHARAVVVPQAGHAVHLEQPAAFARAVRDFLEASIGADAATTPPKEGMPCP